MGDPVPEEPKEALLPLSSSIMLFVVETTPLALRGKMAELWFSPVHTVLTPSWLSARQMRRRLVPPVPESATLWLVLASASCISFVVDPEYRSIC